MTASDVAAATHGRLMGADSPVVGVSTDTREITAGQLFVPIVDRRDGHDFIGDALDRGVTVCLASRELSSAPPTVISVADTLAALADIGRWARARLPERVVGITGSVGKTSVKDLTRAALEPRWRVTANMRSLNNELGLPLTLANAPDDTEVTVVEMGMRGFGQIAQLCEIARPTVGVVTAVADAHTELTGGIDGVARAKGELIAALPLDGMAVLNADDARVAAMAALTDASVLTFGTRGGDVRAVDVRLDDLGRVSFRLCSPWGDTDIQLQVSGAHNAINAAAAAAVALSFGTPLDSVAVGLGAARLSPWRMEVRATPSGAVVINDAYNANPASMRAALDVLVGLPATGRRVAILGVMAELDEPSRQHAEIAALVAGMGVELLAVGTDLYGASRVADFDEAVDALGPLVGGDVVLVKASRVAGLERLAARLLA
ncbi:MAG: UDP-N-acetylmuramoyl-tripeptide--D-alanyl-D-alanine ligase [Acidimicrobiaceae bacterium]|nr:UDP-N-acetylmuramoyl-tripeptide--D-alanyl-D-alanine ligase [Acidimicrobiaceae bacterium]